MNACVLIGIIGVISGINFYNLNERADALLQMISDGGGKFDTEHLEKRYGSPESSSGADNAPPEPKDDEKKKPRITNIIGAGDVDIETRYSTRYFYVKTDLDNNIKIINTSHIAKLNAKDTRDFAKEILESGKETGYIDGYKFLVTTSEKSKLVVVIDFNSDISTAVNFLIISCLVGFGSLVLVTVLVALLSRRAIKPMVENMERQKRFITDAGHEIKTPLAIIKANIDLMDMEIDSGVEGRRAGLSISADAADSLRDNLGDINDQVRRLTDLTNDLVYLSRMEEAENTLVMTDIPLSDIVSETVSSFQPLAEEKGRVISANIAPMLTVRGSRDARHSEP